MPTSTTTLDPTISVDISPPGGGLHLDCIKARGIQLRKNYFSENINYSDTLLTTLELRFVSGKKASGNTFIEDLQEWKNHIDNIAGIGLGEWRPGGIAIYGLSFLNCRISSADFPTNAEARQNGVFGGTVTVQIEERRAGDLSNLAGRSNYDTLTDQLGLYGHLIDDLSEDFEFTLEKGTQYGFTHSVNIRLTELAAPQLAATQSIAMEILNPTRTVMPSFGFAHNVGAYATFAPTVSPYYSESVDLAAGDYSLTKTFKTYADQVGSAPAYTYELTHSITQDQTGVVSITESGKVKAKLSAPMGVAGWSEAGRFKHSKDGVMALLTGSYARCNDLYSGGFLPNQSFGVAAPVGQGLDPDTNLPLGPLNLRPLAVNTTKNLDAISQECSYSVTYTDDPSRSWTLLRNVKRESTLSCSQDASGNVIISENVSITNAGDRDAQPVNILSLLSEDHGLQVSEGGVGAVSAPVTFGGVSNWNNLNGTRARIEHFYQTMIRGNASWVFAPFTFKLLSLNYEYAVGGKTGGYGVEFSSDANIFEPAQNGIKRIDLSVEDQHPMRQYQEYPIPQWKVLVQDPEQTSVGARVVSANLALERVPFINRLVQPFIPANSISYATGEIRTKMLSIYADYGFIPLTYPGQGLPMHYVSNQEYTFDSKGGATVQATMSFIQKR